MPVVLLRVREGHQNVSLSRSRSDWAILVDAEIEMSQPAADGVCITAATEDWLTEIVLEGRARPISRERPNGTNIPPVADQAGDISSIVAGETRIGPFDPQLRDGRIVEGKRCVPD